MHGLLSNPETQLKNIAGNFGKVIQVVLWLEID
jgi:hypothetical protein